MRTYYIYKVTNKLNGKIYIGKTNDLSKRKLEHTRYDIGDNSIFHKALLKYGEENFSWEIIDSVADIKNINELEKKYIRDCKSFKPYGYNMTKGGDGGSLWNARAVVCLTLAGEFIKRYDSAGEAEDDGFSNTDVLVSCKKSYRTSKGYMFMFEDEYNQKGPKIYIKPESTSMRKVIQCDLDGNYICSYRSVNDAAKISGANRTTISGVLAKTYKSANGFIFVYAEDYPIKEIDVYRKKMKGKKIAQLNPKTNEVIKTFSSIADAGRQLNMNYKSIHKALDLPNRTAFGYKWISQ